LSGAKEAGANTELACLSALTINYCQGCHHCLKQGVCIISDDVGLLIEKLLQADGIVLASPTQAQSISGNMKVFIDRLILQLLNQSFKDKYVASVSVGGIFGMDKVTKYLNDTAWAMGAYKVSSITATSWEKGGISMKSEVLNQANKLGKDLTIAIRAKKTYFLQNFFRRIGPLRLFRRLILMNKDNMPFVYNHWKGKGWL